MIYIWPRRNRSMFPLNIILPFDAIIAPTGWERFTASDDRHIVGAGSTYANGATGGASASISKATSAAGDHDGTGTSVNMLLNAGASSLPGGQYSILAGGGATTGAHAHSLSCDYDMGYRQVWLIKATDNHVQAPANAIVLGTGATTPASGLTIVYDEDVAARVGASINSVAGTFGSEACSNGGTAAEDHSHETEASLYNPTGASSAYSIVSEGFGHTHLFTPTLVAQAMKRTYLTAWKNTSAFFGASGIVALWESTTAPYGWALMDGTNGTLDMRDYFWMFGSAGTAGDQYDVANTIEASFSVTNSDWTHDHKYTLYNNIEAASLVSGKHGSFNATHGHTAANYTGAYLPAYYALTFIQKL